MKSRDFTPATRRLEVAGPNEARAGTVWHAGLLLVPGLGERHPPQLLHELVAEGDGRSSHQIQCHVGFASGKWHPPRMKGATEALPDWERLLAAERHVQHLVPGAVLVGGTAAAMHAGHRRSADGDHVLTDLRGRFDEVLGALESAAGWETERILRPVLILGQMDGILTGIRQLRRTRPLETEVVEGLRVPTLAEMARIKAWLLAIRHTVRDYLDTVVLLERLGVSGVEAALRPFDALYAQQSGASPLSEVAERLAAAAPLDLAAVDLASYRGLEGPWTRWEHVAARGRAWAEIVARIAMEEPS